MKTRDIRWYRKEEEMFNAQGLFNFNDILSVHVDACWFRYSFLNGAKYNAVFNYESTAEFFRVERRDVFEKHYLEWKARNAG